MVKMWLAGQILVPDALPGKIGTQQDRPYSGCTRRMKLLCSKRRQSQSRCLLGTHHNIYAEPNFVGELPESRQRSSWATGEAGQYTTQWAGEMLRLPAAHQITRGAGVTVAVLDTGVERSHPLLVGRLMRGYDFVGGDTDPSEVGVAGQDPAYGHGTHVAGLVALAAPDAKLMPLRVLNRHGIGTIWTLARALVYAVDPDRNPHTDDGAQVINLSLSTRQPTRLLADLLRNEICADDQNDPRLRRAGRRDVVVVAAAGNNSASVPEYPAAELVAGKLAVAASTSTDTLASFSNYGSWVNVAAPGVNIVSSVPGGGYGSWSGTSMATPLTAGVAALVRAHQPAWSAAGVARRVQEFAVAIEGPVGRRVDAAAAVAGTPALPSNNLAEAVNAP
jgi:thermitase